MSKRSLTATMVAAALLVVPTATVAAAQGDEPPVPAEFTDPTPESLAESVHLWDPSGHVSVIETLTTEGEESVVSLDSDILFAFGSADLPDAGAERIETLLAAIPSGAAVSVVGHTDDVGSDADNLALSERRAAAVAAVIAAARADLVLSVEGRGESQPVESNSDPEGREANRRVEIRYRG